VSDPARLPIAGLGIQNLGLGLAPAFGLRAGASACPKPQTNPVQEDRIMTLFSFRRALGTAGRTARRTVVPRCEVLEDRTVPSTFTVMNLNDGGPGSLRDAIAMANANPGADTIVIPPRLTGIILLRSGELLITDSVTITGPGANHVAVSGRIASRIFEVAAGTTDTISGLTISGGNGVANNPSGTSYLDGIGGGILNFGSLTISNCTLSGNTALYGGGIENYGTLTVSGSTLSSNSAGIDGGGIDNIGGTLWVIDSTLSGNSANGGGGPFGATVHGGGGIFNDSDDGPYNFDQGSVLVFGSTLSGNSASNGGGGGIFNSFGILDVLGRTRRRHELRFAAPIPQRSRLRRQRRGVVDLHRAARDACEPVAVWAERHLMALVAPFEGEEFLAGLRIPHLHLTIRTTPGCLARA
jgi:hypothetical protein